MRDGGQPHAAAFSFHPTQRGAPPAGQGPSTGFFLTRRAQPRLPGLRATPDPRTDLRAGQSHGATGALFSLKGKGEKARVRLCFHSSPSPCTTGLSTPPAIASLSVSCALRISKRVPPSACIREVQVCLLPPWQRHRAPPGAAPVGGADTATA